MISIGIDIGSFSVKLAEVQSSAKSFSFTRFQEFPLSSDPTRDKKIEILDILRQIAQAYDPSQTRIVMSMPQHQVALRYRHFPFKERFKIMRSIAFELEDDIPFSQEDSTIDAKITRYVDNSADVLASACPNEYIKELISLAREAGLEPEILSVEGVALGNHFEKWQEAPPQVSALAPTPEARPAELTLHIGHSRTVMMVHCEGSLITARNIDWGGRNIAEALSQKYGLHHLEAMKELQKKAFVLLSNEGATRDQVQYSDVIKASFEPFTQDVRFSILELQNSRNIKINKAFISGGVSQIKHLGAFITAQIEIATNRLKFLPNFSQVSIDQNPALEAHSAIAVGLAVEGLRRPRNPAVNLLKGEFALQSETWKNFWQKWGFTSRIVMATFAALVVFGFVRETLAVSAAEKALETLRGQAAAIADLKGKSATASSIRKYVKQKKEEIQARKYASQVKTLNSALDVMTQVHQAAPNNKQMLVELRKFNLENEILELHGEVADRGAIAKFRQSLENVASDGKVEPISPAISAGPGRQAFAFRLKVDRHRGG